MTLFQDDRSLLDRFRSGDKKALSRVYHFHVHPVETLIAHGFAHGSAPGRVPGIREIETVRELVQEVFVRAFAEKARLSYDGLRPYKPYLLAIARNLLIDHWRKRPTDALGHAVDSIQEDLVQIPLCNGQHGPAAEEDLHWQRCLEACNTYVASLDHGKRELVRLRFHEELPQQEVAQKLGLSRWKVRSLEQAVLNGLHKYLRRVKLR